MTCNTNRLFQPQKTKQAVFEKKKTVETGIVKIEAKGERYEKNN